MHSPNIDGEGSYYCPKSGTMLAVFKRHAARLSDSRPGTVLHMADLTHISELESAIERNKADLREYLTLIKRKAHQTREELCPSRLMAERVLGLAILSFLLGFVLGYKRVPIGEIGKPAAKAAASTGGKQAAQHLVASIW